MKYRGYDIEIVIDENPQDPREFDNAFEIIAFHRRYEFTTDGSKHLKEISFDNLKELYSYLQENENAILILPVFLYDHSGLRLSVRSSDFRACDPAGWDWGQLGFVYITQKKLDEYGIALESVEKQAVAFIKMMDAYVSGEVYGFEITLNDEFVDSCYGFYSRAEAEEEAKSVIDHTIKHRIVNHIAYLKKCIKSSVNILYRKPFKLTV